MGLMKKIKAVIASMCIGIMLFGTTALTYALEGDVIWGWNVGGDQGETFTSTIETADGGFLVAGYTSSTTGVPWSNSGMADGLIVKFNGDGSIAWAYTYGGELNDYFADVIETSDGYIVIGYSYSTTGAPWGAVSTGSSTDAIVMKIDKNGGVIWAQNHGDVNGDFFSAISENGSGYFVVGGSSSDYFDTGNYPSGANQVAIGVQIDPVNGNIIWSKSYGGGERDQFNSVTKVSDGSLVVTGVANGATSSSAYWGPPLGLSDAIVAKIDSANGNVIWARNYGGSNHEVLSDLVETNDGNYLVVGDISSNVASWGGLSSSNPDALVLKLNSSNGDVIWGKTYGGTGYDYFTSVLIMHDGGIAIAGTTTSPNFWPNKITTDNDALIVEIDASDTNMGTIVWSQLYGGTGDDRFNSMIVTSTGAFIASGISTSTNSRDWGTTNGGYDGVIMKLEGLPIPTVSIPTVPSPPIVVPAPSPVTGVNNNVIIWSLVATAGIMLVIHERKVYLKRNFDFRNKQ